MNDLLTCYVLLALAFVGGFITCAILCSGCRSGESNDA